MDKKFVSPGERDKRYTKDVKDDRAIFDSIYSDKKITVHFNKDNKDKYDVIFSNPKFNYSKVTENMKSFLEEQKSFLDLYDNFLKSNGTLLIHHHPLILANIKPILSDNGFFFRYWVALEIDKPELFNSQEGIIMMFKDEDDFHYNYVREPHQMCDSCGRFLKDWGGKSHKMDSKGYVISDVWSDCKFKRSDVSDSYLSEKIIDRVIAMTSKDNYDYLFYPFQRSDDNGL